MGALVRLENVTKTFGDGPQARTAVDDVSLDVERGEVLGVIGYSGAGKSTLVRLINALELPTSGTITVDGHELTSLPERRLREVRSHIGMIFQQFNLFHSRTVAGNVAYPLAVAGVPKAQREERVAELLEFVGLSELARQHPEQLSGGQKQRVGIARALAAKPTLLLADEATSALDPDTTAEVLALLRRVNRELGVTIVVITHEMDAVRRVADRVAVMDSGRIVERGEVYDVFAQPQTATAARFVRTVLHDRPRGETLERLRRLHRGAFLTIAVADTDTFSSLVQATFERHGVAPVLVFGGISELRQRAIGSLTYSVEAPDGTVEAIIDELTENGLTAERTENEQGVA